MSKLVLNGDTSGSVTLDAPAVSGTTILTLPTTTGTIIASNSSGNLLFNSGYGSVATAYGCRAWVNFNGTGTIAIRGSGNITSLTDSGVGLYGINFTNSMPDVNYSASVGGSLDGFAGSASYGIGIYNLSTTLMNLACRTEANAYADFQFVTASIHR